MRGTAYIKAENKIKKKAHYTDMITQSHGTSKAFNTPPYYMITNQTTHEKEKNSMKGMFSMKPAEDLEFFTKTKSGGGSRPGTDISITIQKSNNPNNTEGRVSFTFRNGADAAITKTGYVVFAIKKNRVFFKESNSVEGYKMTMNKEFSNSKYVKTTFSEFKDFVGDYNLMYDEFYELYYVEKN